MPATLRIAIDGDDAETVAQELTAILAEGASQSITRSVKVPPPDQTSKVIDPVAVLGVILAVPSSLLAVGDIVDRIHKRKKASDLVSVAKRLCREKRVSIVITAADGSTFSLDQLEADRVLAIADGPEFAG
jgi:hypothetical protein